MILNIPELTSAKAFIPFKKGETIKYSIHVGNILVGNQTMKYYGYKYYNGEKYHFAKADTISEEYIRKTYNYILRDIMWTYMDTETMLPVIVKKSINEGSWKDRVLIKFNHIKKKGKYYNKRNIKGKRFKWRNRILEVLSMIYYIRSRDLKPGNVFTFEYLDEKTFKAQKTVVRIKRGKPVKQGGRVYRTIEAYQKSSKIAKEIRVIMIDNKKRVPIKIVIGAFKVAGYTINIVGDLIEYKAGR